MAARRSGTVGGMKLLRTAALAGIAKKVYDEARKPENQAKIKNAANRAKAEYDKRRKPRPH